MTQRAKNKKEHRQIVLTCPCTCGATHRLLLGLGELQIFERAIYKGKSLEDFTLRHTILPSPAQVEETKRALETKAKSDALLKDLKAKKAT